MIFFININLFIPINTFKICFSMFDFSNTQTQPEKDTYDLQ